MGILGHCHYPFQILLSFVGMGKMRRTSVHRSVVARVGGSTSASFVIKDFATEVANCRSREILESSPFRLLDRGV